MSDIETPQPATGTTNVYVGQPPAASATNGLAVASLVLGVLAILTAWIPIVGFIAWILAPAGLILGIVGMGKPNGKGLAIAGVICSVIGLLICITWVVLVVIAASAASTLAPAGY